MSDGNGQTADGKLTKLLGWLEQDKTNLALLGEAIEAAIEENQLDTARQLVARYEAIETLSPLLRNLAGIIAMKQEDFTGAADIFGALVKDGYDSIQTRFNLAWTYAVSTRETEALALIDMEMCESLPQAAALKIQLMHASGMLDEAMEEAEAFAAIHADDPALMAAISVLALDTNNLELARSSATKAAGQPDGMATIGTIALADSKPQEALGHFDAVLAVKPHQPRAWLGRGLAEMALGNNDIAAANLDKGAEIFGTHIGSWIAAGWAYFVKGDYEVSRERFEKALAIDPAFAESQGSMAVINIVQGRTDEAQKYCETALRLDRKCFSAALAKSLIERAGGNADKADRIVKLALETPIDSEGRTMRQALVAMNTGIGKASGK